VGAKNTLDLTYLAVAEQLGASVGTRYEALRVGPADGADPGADGGYTVRLRDRRERSAPGGFRWHAT
jgi:hypothetical protein